MSKDTTTYVRKIRINDNTALGINSNGTIYILDMDSPSHLRIIDSSELIPNIKQNINELIRALTKALESTMR